MQTIHIFLAFFALFLLHRTTLVSNPYTPLTSSSSPSSSSPIAPTPFSSPPPLPLPLTFTRSYAFDSRAKKQYLSRVERKQTKLELERRCGEGIRKHFNIEWVKLVDPKNNTAEEMTLDQALQVAKDSLHDVILMNEDADPPLCKLMNAHKWMVNEARELSKQRKGYGWKQVEISDTIAEFDLARKVLQIRQWMEKGTNIQVTVRFKRHWEKNEDLTRAMMTNILHRCEDIANMNTSAVVQEKSQIFAQIIPSPGKFRNRQAKGIFEKSVGEAQLDAEVARDEEHRERVRKKNAERKAFDAQLKAKFDKNKAADAAFKKKQEEMADPLLDTCVIL
eukprot:TRINITY_DN2444_c0_g1_i1.p1 TRINITY_DN2444_c0_g1~~TRINITY_DN2444_c0_g1_i1.p1  ORF type:complete len:335 (+),score=110.76 TRINITY_DN2444_c0_g1_i1:87-1091(+)